MIEPGKLLGPFRIESVIGSGAMGTVYRAVFTETQRPVAIKIIAMGLAGNESALARFEREADILKQLKHPHIVRLFATGRYKKTPFIAMEFVEGQSLEEALERRGRLTWEEVARLGKQLCLALQHAHEKGIIHRDLKPSNLMILKDGTLKLTDFGIAKATQGRLTEKTLFTQFQQFIGTPAYMSPEQAEMSSMDVDTRTDVYALGVLLYELLTGTTPFPEKRLRSLGYGEMQRVIIDEEPERPSTRLSTMANEQKTAVAKNRGEELASLSNLLKGDLDWVVKGQTVPEFEKALFDLKPNEISGVVKTTYGYHIIQALEKQEAHLKSLDEVRGELTTELKKQMGQNQVQSVLDNVAAALKKNPQDVEQIAAQYHLNVVKVEKAGAGDPIPEIGVNRDFDDAISALKKGEVSQPVAAPGNRMIIAVITDVFPAHAASFEEAESQIRPALVQEKTSRLVNEKGDELAAKVKAMNGDLKKAQQMFRALLLQKLEADRHRAHVSRFELRGDRIAVISQMSSRMWSTAIARSSSSKRGTTGSSSSTSHVVEGGTRSTSQSGHVSPGQRRKQLGQSRRGTSTACAARARSRSPRSPYRP
jgi:serine/threonine protein kinase